MLKRAQMETENKNVANLDPITALKLKHMKFICAMHDFIETVENIAFEPKTIALSLLLDSIILIASLNIFFSISCCIGIC